MEQRARAERIVAANIEKWGWGPIDEIDGLSEHKLAVDAVSDRIPEEDMAALAFRRAADGS